MSERINSRQFHAADTAGDWRLFPEPDVDIRGDGVTVLLRAFKGEAYGLTHADLKLAPAIDRHGRGAPFWFENMDELRSDGGGTIHPVVWIPWDEAESRVAAGVAAGGRVVRHDVEERFWTLADPAGNEVDIATTTPPER